ncbi:DUF308 domain-containing protein [Mycolicibacterium rhodesiae]|uniref:Integral membrane protein n=1 Tax=Mycolicibacterium rhodesiae TaxID=36814 RepID=A0A1X0J199_MYCRH|nr:DUF308 domain-containing protein [Mycolicibacterium rhodesiae]MCV7344943.1 DUF308 domain-containing protein [Mycolicibacterium rhodesiae]ORB55621.1 hypothetical protein BST42_04125 [Mycolicibacterium rhodesiae]
MTETVDHVREHAAPGGHTWLERYYYARAAFSIAWVGAAVTLADSSTVVIATLLLIYPAWDAVANLIDGQRNGGLRRNPTQAVNSVVSVATTVAVAIALTSSMNAVFGVFGIWAAMSGLLQLSTGVRRWKDAGGQWPMVISGIQSAVAGASFLVQAASTEVPHLTAIAPYAAFGAFYFLLSAVVLTVGHRRRRRS